MDSIPFCERNTKLWVGLLSLSGFIVLAYAGFIALERGELNGFTLRKGSNPSSASQNSGSHINGKAHVQRAKMGVQVAQTFPANLPNGSTQFPSGASQIPNAPYYRLQSPNPNIDQVTRATPNGGYRLINGPQGLSIQEAFNRAADISRPTVVNINCTRRQVAPIAPRQTLPGPRFIEPFNGAPERVFGRTLYKSVGSGLIISSAGHIITNLHVVEKTSGIVLSGFLARQKNLSAQVIASDHTDDLALLQVQGDGPFQPAKLADSNHVEVGDWVLAVGNPFGLEHTVTSGIISGRRHKMSIGGVLYSGLIQTDAPINRGSSGGPLVNLYGDVIGINTAIYAPTGVFNGAGFAIPSNRVHTFIDRIRDQIPIPVAPRFAAPNGNTQPTVGVGVNDMNPHMAQRLLYPHAGGVFVNTVINGSPAEDAEIQRGDIITAVSSWPVPNSRALHDLFSNLQPGNIYEITVWRDGRSKKLSLTIR